MDEKKIKKYLVFDTETTGLCKKFNQPPGVDDNWPHVIQIAWILYNEAGRRLEKASFIIKQDGVESVMGAVNVHKISNSLVKEVGTNIYAVLGLFQDAIRKSDYIVAHNSAFDYGVVESEFMRLGLKSGLDPDSIICTMKESIDYVAIPGTQKQRQIVEDAKESGKNQQELALLDKKFRYKAPKLQELYNFLFEESFEMEHDGLADAEACARCFFKLKALGVIDR